TYIAGRAMLVKVVLELGWSVEATAKAVRISTRTVYKWLRRFRLECEEGVADRRLCAVTLGSATRAPRKRRRTPGVRDAVRSRLCARHDRCESGREPEDACAQSPFSQQPRCSRWSWNHARHARRLVRGQRATS